jgi:hypothetical protein
MKLVSVIKSNLEEHRANEPLILLTMGDANGIGPEIILKIYNETSYFTSYNLKVAGSKKIMDYYAQIFNLNEIPSDLFCEIPVKEKFDVKIGEINKSAGKYSGDCVAAAAKMCLEKKVEAMVTLPISKEAFNLRRICVQWAYGNADVAFEFVRIGNAAVLKEDNCFTGNNSYTG